MYSQDLPDWKYISRLSRDMLGFMACGFLVLRKAILRVCPYFIGLLAAIFNSLSNILCKHLFYYRTRVEQSKPFISSFICQFLLQCQSVVKPYRHAETAIRESMCPARYPEKHMPCLHPRHKRDQPVPLLSRVLGPRLNLDSKLPHLRPSLKVVLRPPPIPVSNQSVRKEPEPMIRG
jgi:hypothetical protein